MDDGVAASRGGRRSSPSSTVLIRCCLRRPCVRTSGSSGVAGTCFFSRCRWFLSSSFDCLPKRIIDRTFRRLAIRKETFTDEDLRRFHEALAKPGALTAAINYYRATFRNFSADARARALAEDDRRIRPCWSGRRTTLLSAKSSPTAWSRCLAGRSASTTCRACSHWVNEEQPELVNRLLLEFLDDGIVRMAVEIRRMTRDDIPEVGRIGVEAFNDLMARHNRPPLYPDPQVGPLAATAYLSIDPERSLVAIERRQGHRLDLLPPSR